MGMSPICFLRTSVIAIKKLEAVSPSLKPRNYFWTKKHISGARNISRPRKLSLKRFQDGTNILEVFNWFWKLLKLFLTKFPETTTNHWPVFVISFLIIIYKTLRNSLSLILKWLTNPNPSK